MNSYILCATQTTNLGDLVINKMLIDELCHQGKVFVDAYGLADDFRKYLFENENAIDVYGKYHFSLKKFNLLPFIRLVKNENIKVYTHSPGPLYNLGNLKRFAFDIIQTLVKSIGAKVLNIGNCASAAILQKRVIKDNTVEHFYLRSLSSVEYVEKFYPLKVSYIPDLAFLLKYRVESVAKEKNVAFNFRPIAQDLNILKQKCIKIINDFINEGYKVILYYQVKGDEEFVKNLYAEFNTPAVAFRKEIVWYDDLDFYNDKAFVISNRLHSLLVGAVYGAIPIVFSNSEESCAKIRHVFETVFKDYSDCFVNDYDQEIDVLSYIENQSKYSSIVNEIVLRQANECRLTIENI